MRNAHKWPQLIHKIAASQMLPRIIQKERVDGPWLAHRECHLRASISEEALAEVLGYKCIVGKFVDLEWLSLLFGGIIVAPWLVRNIDAVFNSVLLWHSLCENGQFPLLLDIRVKQFLLQPVINLIFKRYFVLIGVFEISLALLDGYFLSRAVIPNT